MFRELHEAAAERQHDQETEQVRERRVCPREPDDRRREQKGRDRRGDVRDVLHHRAGQADRARLQLGLCDEHDLGVAARCPVFRIHRFSSQQRSEHTHESPGKLV